MSSLLKSCRESSIRSLVNHRNTRVLSSVSSIYQNVVNQTKVGVKPVRIGDSKPKWIPFSRPKYGNFSQEMPRLSNQWTGDPFLQKYLQRVLPKEMYSEINQDLTRFGDRVANDIYELGVECDRHLPKLIQQNAWGQTCNDLYVCNAWKQQKTVSAEEGIVAIGYERKYHEFSRLYQFAKLYLYAPSSGLYSCPIAMTDGAAKTIESLDLKTQPIYEEVFNNLTTRDPKRFFTSGQWMTEKGGGSDVAGGTETVAVPMGRDIFKLYGYKWFSSATDADIALTLARIADDEGNVLQGTRGLTLFFLKLRDENNRLNDIDMIRLKDKLGTRQVPTAELLLDGTVAHKMSEEGRGVAAIANMLQITRIHNAIGSASYMRRILTIARDYAQRRKAFGKPISQYPIHMQTLARMDTEAKGAFIMAFENVRLLGRQEQGLASDEELLLLRLLNPISKLFVCKQSMSTISEGLEAFGGQGAMEDTGLPVMLRDSQIFVIWEGTTNILALDVLRVMAKTGGEALKAFKSHIKSRLDLAANHAILKDEALKVQTSVDTILDIVYNNPNALEAGSRDFAFSLARLFIASALLENSCLVGSTDLDETTALRWCRGQDLAPFITNYGLNLYNKSSIEIDYKLVMNGYSK
ncbi:acyl-CoA dehydrogenase family member 11-like [Oppia nitens]|uniref:acyl-CoA dehydrogenase family member 11-like n=1 Tax=Oppia nitens TaxID=1686743 RepID=UPI0023DBAD72|nr:acyl-CoA dehydrogenase family member 11-like [Oppia nitens]